MPHFLTNTILELWQGQLADICARNNCGIEREYKYIDQSPPFRAIHMGKKNDEYFLDAGDKKIAVDTLLCDLDLLVIKDFSSINDLNLSEKQAKKATSIADLYIRSPAIEIVLELEVFKDKPFSNLIFIPQVCAAGRHTQFFFIHCFAPERHDKEADLTRGIGKWLEEHQRATNYKYLSFIMPSLPESIRYLLPHKKARKPTAYQRDCDQTAFCQYVNKFGEEQLVPTINRLLRYSVISTGQKRT